MREILFRGKREENGKWAEGYYLTVKNNYMGVEKSVIITPENAAINGNGDLGGMWIVIPETVGQYTGLTDKNGKKIFEGDIVITNTTSYEFIGCIAHSAKYVRFVCVTSHNIPYSIDSRFKYEIIGNIFDNPELLK